MIVARGQMHEFDRYVSFRDVDWEGRASRVMAGVTRHIEAGDSPFWPYFERQRALAQERGLDDLRVLHNFLPTLRELLEALGDMETLALLEDLEQACM
jgi:hypothetical protein